MSGIAHLSKDNKTRASRIDSLDTDSVNSIIERISGVNPTKLAEGDKSPPSPQAQSYGAPPSPITENFQQPQQHGMYQQPGQDPQMQQVMQRMQMLEQKVAYYEGDDTETAAAKKVRTAKSAQTNRGTDSSAFAPNMDSKAAAKKIMEPDVADGKTDKKAQPGGQAMPQERTNILGISMNEWNDLIGVTTPYDAVPAQAPELSESREDYGEVTEGYFTEDELAEAWFEFIADKGFDPGEFSRFVEDADHRGDEVALLAIQDLEDEFQEAVDAFLEGEEDTSDHADGIEEVWEMWLESRGLSVEMFNHLIDTAIASEDTDEMDALLAVEELFHQQVESGDVALPAPHPRASRGGDKPSEVKTSLRGAPPKLGRSGAPKPGKLPVSKSAEKEMSGPAKMSKLDQMLKRSKNTYRNEAEELKGRSLVHGSGPRSIQFPGEKPGTVKSLRGGGVKAARKGVPSITPAMRKKMKADHDKAQATKKSGQEDPRKWAGQMGLADSIRRFPGRYVHEEHAFECGSDDDGNPDIPWATIMKSYNLKGDE